MLVRLLYASRSKSPIDDKTIQNILDYARSHNEEAGITGVLCVYESGDTYLQVLEGSREQVNALYGTIAADDRHTNVTLLHYGEIDQRRFSSWRMGNVNLSKVNRSTILRFSPTSTLDPFKLRGEAALKLLEELVDTAAISSQNDGH
ncbi:MAG: BLUF domain-containing protein [Pseudomonadota bacterium]